MYTLHVLRRRILAHLALIAMTALPLRGVATCAMPNGDAGPVAALGEHAANAGHAGHGAPVSPAPSDEAPGAPDTHPECASVAGCVTVALAPASQSLQVRTDVMPVVIGTPHMPVDGPVPGLEPPPPKR